MRQGELFSVPATGGPETQLTRDAGEGVTNGLAEYIAQEEMNRRRGFWINAAVNTPKCDAVPRKDTNECGNRDRVGVAGVTAACR